MPLGKSGRVELVVGVKECSAVSPLVDQMELPKGVVVDQGFLLLPRTDEVGTAEELLSQECRGLLGTSQIDVDAELNSDQVC